MTDVILSQNDIFASFPSFMSEKKYEITIKISFIHCCDALSYCFISILLVFSISCLVPRIAHHLIVILFE